MARFVPREQTAFARRLRGEMTGAEVMVWRALRGGRVAGAKFRRQVPVGPYVADFLCLEARLVVEIDGPSHDSDEGRTHDVERDAWFERQGFAVLRFTNDLALTGTEILIREVERALRRAIPSRAAGTPSPFAGEGGMAEP